MLSRFLPLFFASLALTTAVPSSDTTCATELALGGADETFAGSVAHAIHSITVEDLQAFESSVTENNRVPTINMDLTSTQAIIPFAQKRTKTGVSEKFITTGMKTLDMVLSRMDQKHWDINGFNTLEKIVHAFHMREIWARVLVEYERIKVQPPSNEFCRCAMDVENNGIMKMMRFAALAIREPDLVYGSPKFSRKNHFYKSVDPQSSFQDYVIPGVIHDVRQSMPPLRNAEMWKLWRGEPISVQDDQGEPIRSSEHYQAALFLYCALNDTS